MKRIIAVFLLGLALSFTVKGQEKVYVPYFDVIGMHPDYQISFTRLFKSYIEVEGRYTAVLGSQYADSTSSLDIAIANSQAKNLGLPYFFIGEINRLSNVTVCSFSMYETESGTKIWDDLLKAQNPDDLDPILNKVARVMGTDAKAAAAGDIYSVTNYDSQTLNQVSAKYHLGLTIGGALPFYRNVQKPFGAGLGAMITYDSRNLILDITAEGYFSDADIYFLSINAHYPFSDKYSTPFLMGGLGLGGVNVAFEDAEYDMFNLYADQGSGLMLFFGGGYLINRHSAVNLRLGARSYIPFFQVKNQLAPGLMFNVTALF